MNDLSHKLYMLRQMVASAKEAKAMGWDWNHLGIEDKSNSPGDLYEYQISACETLIQEIEEDIRERRERENSKAGRPAHEAVGTSKPVECQTFYDWLPVS
jgi:hypothetical protein